ncbi:MAG TPA: CPBP family intramembrane glutamic endopeptidase [Thermomicrobiaceae bacterium]|nr:CPBP family intramembrane glutamic endopeptidase [Thermomicrobiaceae bacterium]
MTGFAAGEPGLAVREVPNSYPLRRIVAIWALAVAPMVVLGWVVAPLVGDRIYREEGIVRGGLLTIGLAWLVVFSLLLVRQEEGNLAWGTVKRRLRLNAPISPRTGQQGGRLWWWVVLLVVLYGLYSVLLEPPIHHAVSALLPGLAEPDRYSLDELLKSHDRVAALEGAWWLVLLFAALGFFNIFGEEFLFRGVLLPKMGGVFAAWTWVANGLIFALYHLHQPWSIPTASVDGIFLLALPAWYFRSTVVPLIVHGSQSIYFLVLVIGIVLGLA